MPNNTIKNIKTLNKYINLNQELVFSLIFKDKCGVYLFIYNINNKSKVVSSIGLTYRFCINFNKNALSKNSMYISLSILEYKRKNFALYNEYYTR